MNSDPGSISEVEDAFENSLLPVLFEARRVLVADPPEALGRGIINSGMCRASTIGIVAAIDALLAGWKRTAPKVSEYITTFTERGNKSAAERAAALGRAFEEFGASIDEGVLVDYTALRDLRHLILHVPPDDERRAEAQRQTVEARGFPRDPSNPYAFGEEDWDRIWQVYWQMRHGIYAIGLFGFAETEFAQEVARLYGASPPSQGFAPS